MIAPKFVRMPGSNAAKPLKVLFVTYGIPRPSAELPAMIGVIKRCARLIANLPPEMVESHLIHFGMMPKGDPLLASLLLSIKWHTLGEGDTRTGFRTLYHSLMPDWVVLGEGPVGGVMRDASEVACEQSIPQVCIDNYYRPRQPKLLLRDFPWVRQWLLLGLPDSCGYGRISDKFTLAPPLLGGASRTQGPRFTLTILGYDLETAERSLGFVRRLPAGTTARLVYSPATFEHHGRLRFAANGISLEWVPLPDDLVLRTYLETSNMVVCKSGFQQMVEALAVGTPVIACSTTGGVPEQWLDPSLRPFVRYIPARHEGWSRLLSAAAIWVSQRPIMPWTEEIRSFPNPSRFAAECLLAILNDGGR